MSNGLTLPFSGKINTDGNGFEIVVSAGGGVAISGSSYGRDRDGAGGTGVTGASDVGMGVFGVSTAGVGVQGQATQSDGVFGVGKNGVHGRSQSPADSGVWGENAGAGYGVAGSTNSPNATGVWGDNQGAGQGVRGTSLSGEGVHGESKSHTWAGVTGIASDPAGRGPGVWAESQGQGPGLVAIGHPAGQFRGDVEVSGDIRLVNADCAEDFDIVRMDEIEPGSVMVIDDEGALQASQHAYDRRVAGVVAGAGDYHPAIVLDRQPGVSQRLPIALVGKVYCKVDARYAPVQVGDLLTTSPTLGHAMKAADPLQAFGAVIGKALRPLNAGQGLIPILIALQ